MLKRNSLFAVLATSTAISLTFAMGASAEELNGSEQEFVKTSAAGGMAEVKFSELAKSKASQPGIKDFASQMVLDHTKANADLKTIAAADRVMLPDHLKGEAATMEKELSELSGAKFDHEYVSVMVKDHDKTVSLFEEESHKAKSASLKKFVDDTLPVLKQHQLHAHELAKEQMKAKM
jgi:putative membrane protein